jgi:hypothetical protein
LLAKTLPIFEHCVFSLLAARPAARRAATQEGNAETVRPDDSISFGIRPSRPALPLYPVLESMKMHAGRIEGGIC